MKHRRIVLTISLAAIVIIMVSSFASRSALGLVVEACKINSVLTGSPYPCLKVVQAQDPLSSYAVLREPADKERTVLAPLADVPGIEDPRLLTAGAPNYFDAAWKERSDAIRAGRAPPQDFALAVNAVLCGARKIDCTSTLDARRLAFARCSRAIRWKSGAPGLQV